MDARNWSFFNWVNVMKLVTSTAKYRLQFDVIDAPFNGARTCFSWSLWWFTIWHCTITKCLQYVSFLYFWYQQKIRSVFNWVSTKRTPVITLTSHKGLKQSIPLKQSSPSKYKWLTRADAKRGKMSARHDWFWFPDWMIRKFFQPIA